MYYMAERKCAICGKVFIGREQWPFKRNGEWYCSWSCLREYERRPDRPRPKRLGESGQKEVMDLLRVGISPQRVAEKFGMTRRTIQYYQMKLREEETAG